MNKKVAAVLVIMGIISIVFGTAVLLHNDSEDRYAKEESKKVLPKLKEEMLHKENKTKDKDLGGEYAGYLAVSKLKLELPVLSQLSDENLKRFPCLYTSSTIENIIIGAHNYKSHFGKINLLNVGDEVEFVDINNKKYKYNVCVKEIIRGDASEKMVNINYKLTLFTCDYTGKNRVVVRCN